MRKMTSNRERILTFFKKVQSDSVGIPLRLNRENPISGHGQYKKNRVTLDFKRMNTLNSRLGGAFYPTTSLALSSDENKCARVCHGSVKWPCLRMRRHPFGCAAACEMNLESEWDPATEKRRPTDWQWHCMPHSAWSLGKCDQIRTNKIVKCFKTSFLSWNHELASPFYVRLFGAFRIWLSNSEARRWCVAIALKHGCKVLSLQDRRLVKNAAHKGIKAPAAIMPRSTSW